MQRFWLTTHWPPEREDQRPHRDVFLQDSFSELTHELRPGDGVMIYEFMTGQPRMDESGRRVPKLEKAAGVL